MGRALREAGFAPDVFALDPSTGARGMDELAEDLAGFVSRRLDPGDRFGLVGFSMGAIVARYYVQRLGGVERVTRLILLSAPNQGTWPAWLLPLRGIRQLRAGSSFLRGLNRDVEDLERVRPASIWSPIDPMIIPPSSSRLGPGLERRFLIPVHAWIPRSRRVIETVTALLGDAAPA